MLREGEPIGVIGVGWAEPGPISKVQEELLKTFADQAVIAIENTRLLNELRQRTNDLTESLEQQTASGEILASISGSLTDTKPVFDAIVRNLLRLFGSRWACVQVLHDGIVHMPAIDGEAGSKKLIDYYPQPLDENTMGGRAMQSKQVLQFSEIENNSAVPLKTQQFAREFGFRSAIFAPMIRDNKVIGAIGVANFKPKVFSDKQVALIKAFADQAVIAIENTRLLNELRERTDSLTESLEQQTATSEVLSIISSSAGELQPVFETMLAKATALCEASYGTMWLCDGDAFRAGAIHGALPEAFLQLHRTSNLYRAGPGAPAYEAIINRQPCAVVDLRETRGYREGSELPVAAADIGGVRTMVAVPMFQEDEPIGVISIYRREVRPFSDKQIELVSNFAKQAVIAIENTRLLNELHQRTDDLSESLEQQTATSEVLGVISSSPGELAPVFNSMLVNATRICGAKFGVLFLTEGDGFRSVAMHGLPPAHAEERRREPIIYPDPDDPLRRLANTKQ
ncbi:MAG: GAF domain-containing protein, partial [Pseudolabrys sp.]